MFSLLQQTAPAAVETTTAASEGARVTTITVPLGEPGAATAASPVVTSPVVAQPVQSAPVQTVTTAPATTDAVGATPVTTTADPVAVAPATDAAIAPVQADAGLAHTATTPVDAVIATPDGAHAVVTHAAPSADAVHAVTAGGHEATASAGMPQLDFSTFGNQIFWLLVTLVVIYLILSRVALPRISRILADRQGLMTSDLAAAEELKRKARDAEAAYDRALAEARTEAGKIVAANKAEIDAGLKAAMERADAEISARTAESERRIGEIRASAVDDARTVARDVAADLLRAFGGKADAAAVDAAVDARLKGAVQ